MAATVSGATGAAMADCSNRDVLIVDDEAFLRLLLVDLFEDEGFAVREACDAHEAIAILTEDAGTVELVVSDVRMPGKMNGFELASWIQDNRPEIKVIMMSGYYAERDVADGAGLHEFLPKPFPSSQMIALARKLLSPS